ncbi:D-ribose-binding periplasmic protein [Thalictrum thalictroides]|uniref:D-ribose-binding periplasmic protein n=1 Tax=Thalictrum thalictroides TaxID=46969 RepID=A0A7J6XFS0_THATH|nr:D-ribose-binding periplasmic protein [Thalictrum thalictroides]
MGNCQAIDAASLVIQHPSGRVERFYWPMTVSEVMRVNQGHYVALVITLGISSSPPEEKAVNDGEGVRFTRVKLLRPTDTLVLGKAYRLITTEEVMKGLWERKYAKMKKKNELESTEKQPQSVHLQKNSGCEIEARKSESENMNKPAKHERHRQKTMSSSGLPRSRHWRPSLQSISEATS